MPIRWWQYLGIGIFGVAIPAWAEPSPVQLQRDEDGNVSLQLINTSAQDAFAALMRGTNWEIATQPNNLLSRDQRPQLLNIKIDHQPYWEAFRQICVASRVNPQPYYDNTKRFMLAEEQKNWFERPRCIVDQFMATLDSVNIHKNIDLSQPNRPAQKMLTIQGMIYVDPQLKIGEIDDTVRVESAVDDMGRSLISPGKAKLFRDEQARGYYRENTDSLVRPFQINMPVPQNLGRKITRLSGALRVLIYKEQEKWEVDNVLNAQGAEKSCGPYTYKIKSVVRENNGQGYRVTVRIESGLPQGADDPTPIVNASNNAKLVGKSNSEWICNGSWSNDWKNSEYIWSFYWRGDSSFNGKEKPQKLVIDIPAEAEERIVPLTFTGISLP